MTQSFLSEGSTLANSLSPTTSSIPPSIPSTVSPQSTNPPDPPDIEDDLSLPVPGWPRVAMLMAKTPDFASLSRFRDLNLKSLLYYQAELTRLRKKLHKQEWRDYRRGEGKVTEYAARADYLIDSGKLEGSGKETKGARKQWDLVLQIRGVLKDYNEALLQYSQVCALAEPENYNMRTFRQWLRDKNAGHFCIGGNGEESTWGPLYEAEQEESGSLKWQCAKMLWRLLWPRPPEENDQDLVATSRPQKKVDGLTRWVANEFVPWHHGVMRHRRGKRSKHAKDLEKAKTRTGSQGCENGGEGKKKEFQQETLSTYSESSMLKFTSSVSTVVACLLPTVAIVVLSKVHDIDNLLWCLAGFATVFSIGLIFLTNAGTSRVEIFTATAAFSAVLVVFISVPVVIVN